MNKKLFIRKAHRYIGLIVSLQLLAWTLGGIWFTWNDIDDIHGDYLRQKHNNPQLNSQIILPVQKALDNIEDFKYLNSIKVIDMLGQSIYRINYNDGKVTLVSAATAQKIPEITKQQAINIAKRNAAFQAEIMLVELIESTDSHHEYREKPLPAWAITFDYPSSPTFYVSTKLGALTSIRHDSWRVFDFFWMLHTMDYQTRDDFGNWLIKIFSVIALITALSGIVLFIISTRRKRR